jgi:hypothetical protein
MTRRAVPAAAIALAAFLGGCDFKVTNPGPLLDADLNNASAIPALVNGMGGDLSNAIGNYLTRGSLAALELRHSGNFAAERRFAAGTIGPEDVNGDWARLHTARYVAEAGLVRMKTVLGTAFETNANTPRAYLYAGYANRFLGENVCNAVYDGGPALPNSSHFVRAESLFTRALTISRALNNTALTNAALAGRALRANGTAQAGQVWGNILDYAQRLPLREMGVMLVSDMHRGIGSQLFAVPQFAGWANAVADVMLYD